MEKLQPLLGYLAAVAAALLGTLAGLVMSPRFDVVNIAMAYLLAVVVVALRFTRGPAILSAILCVLAFDILFVPPQGVLTVNDAQYLFTFAIMLAVALVISSLMDRGRREAEARANLALEAQTERIRSTLLASISHDLRTPLAVLTGASSTLVQGGERLGASEREALARSIYEQARDLSEQVDKVLQMTRLEAGAIALERDWVAIPEVAGSVIAKLSDRLASHRLIAEVPSDLPLVRVDANLIEQVIANLLDNAARHTPPGTVVFLRARQVEGEVVVSVEDCGPGLADADTRRLFAKFERATQEEKGRGVGLGLAICRAIVTLHGGRAWAERSLGGGLAVRFSLPVEQAPRAPADSDST